MEFPLCSILVVNYNGERYLDRCLRSFEELNYPVDKVEILLVDDGSADGSEVEAQDSHPQVHLFRNPVNNFAAALNLGISKSQGSYVAFVNNDVFVSPSWLRELVEALERDPRIGCGGGKILFEDGRINSVGHRTLPDFYWEDDGYGEDDQGQYDTQREVAGLCWAAVLFRKACLDDVGAIDEDFVMYYEDVDTSLRCRELGWKSLYCPRAVARHVFHGSSQGSNLAEFFSDRNRLLSVAKHDPEALPRAIKSSRFLINRDYESLYNTLPVMLKKLILHHSAHTSEQVLERVCETLIPRYGSLAVDHLLARMQVILGQRKMSIGFYDHALHVIGGGQRYGCMMAAALQDHFDVTLAASKPVTLPDLERWYGLSLSGCKLEILPMPFFDKLGTWIDSAAVTPDVGNPFETVSRGLQRFDVLVNVNMQTMLAPLNPFSVFLCHFPESKRDGHFAVDDYSCLMVNSLYTAQWVKLLWGLEPDLLVYPPVEMEALQAEKQNLILSAARFEPGGSKKQREIIRAFESLWTSHPHLLRDWRLVLVGGSLPQNDYLEEIERVARESAAPVEVRINVPFSELQSLYAKTKIFWHACGLGEKDPHLIEHFGMTTVEAMQNRCVPIVFDGGGQREIVEQGQSGYRFSTIRDLCTYTLRVIADPGLMEQLKEAAHQRGRTFTRKRFEEAVNRLFRALEDEYRTIPIPDPGEILRNRPRASLFYSPLARRDTALLQRKKSKVTTGIAM